MTQEEQDEREFEESWNLTDEEEFTHNSYEYKVGKYYFLTSRRLLREKEGKMGKICYDCATEKVNGICPNCYPGEAKMTQEEMDEKIKEIKKIFQDSFTEGLFLLKNPDMGGKNYGLGVRKLENAYKKLPTILSKIKELEESLDFWKKDAGLEQAHSIQCEKRIGELEEKLVEKEPK